ncbi:AmmeMemoRadiSam system radical SAM enzyme [Ruminococcaceae bacterium BL-6]|nr:AmmeMemoRadiSam system radical SAM enzyme [Ruminococcaceae bacterium BL-6]
MTCDLCPHRCDIGEGHTGLCRARSNKGGTIRCGNYGRLTSIALDPVEKKPLARFYPGSRILSVGSYGCNLRCPFCQNSDISMADGSAETVFVSPEQLAQKAEALVPQGNIGIAFTYNEPLVGYEYVRDCSALAKEQGLKTVAVTNGMICKKPLLGLLPRIDAMNIDLKGFTQRFYDWIGGDLETVKQTIRLSAERCHVEVTTLVIPGENDGEDEMDAISAWLGAIDPEIPLHISRFFPRYHLLEKGPTPVGTVYRLRGVAEKHLHHVYAGNC